MLLSSLFISGSSHKKILTVMRKIFAVAAIIISSQAYAQKDTSLLNEVTLTATKFTTKTSQTGKVVVVINRQDIERAGSRDLAQVITDLGGVYINGFNSDLGKEKNIYLRGAKVDYTLITIDGIPIYDASGIGSNFDIRNLSIDNVERIEILKGSQGTLYGSDAIAGVINIITRKGGIVNGVAKKLSVNGAAHYGSYNTFRLNAGINGTNKNFDYNISYSHAGSDGFSEAQKPAASTTDFEKDGYSQNNVQANFGIRAGSKFRVQPFIRYNHNKADLDQDAFTDEKDYTNETKNLQTGVRNTVLLGKGQLNVLYQYNHTTRNYLDDSVKSRNGFYIYNNSDYKANEHFAEALVVYPFNKVKLTAGADFRAASTDYSAVQVSAFGISKPKQSGDSVNQKQVGIYAALNYAYHNFSIEGGGRFNHHSEYGENFAFNFNPSYFYRNTVKVFANLSSGYKTPSLYQLFSAYGNKDLKPESSINLEGGLQVFTKDEKANLRATYFYRSVEDVIAFFFNSTTFQSRYINQDKQKDHGFEIEANAKPSEKLQLKAIYSYVDGKITTKQAGKDTTYFNLLRRPKSTFNFSAGSQVTKAFYVNAQMTVVGDRKDVYFAPPTYAQKDITLESYVLVNFYAEYGFFHNRFKVFADLRNLLDKKYSDIYGYNTAGLNAYGGIRFHF
jgi:vitamin B12 transporter